MQQTVQEILSLKFTTLPEIAATTHIFPVILYSFK